MANEQDEMQKRLDLRRFDMLQEAHRAKLIDVYVDYHPHNSSRSPANVTWENIVPLLFLVLLSLVLLVTRGAIIGSVALILASLVYVLIVRPWIAHRVQERVHDLLMTDLATFKKLWMVGGISITLKDRDHIGVAAPSGDWRVFVRSHLADLLAPGLGTAQADGASTGNADEADGEMAGAGSAGARSQADQNPLDPMNVVTKAGRGSGKPARD